MELDLIKSLNAIKLQGWAAEFQITNEDAVVLLAQAGLQPSIESKALVNAVWELRRSLINTPEWANFSIANALLLTAEDQNPGIESKQLWLRANTNFKDDGITAIQLLLQAAKRQKPGGGL